MPVNTTAAGATVGRPRRVSGVEVVAALALTTTLGYGVLYTDCPRTSGPPLISRCECCTSAQQPGTATPVTATAAGAGRGVADSQAITATQTPRPPAGHLRPRLIVMAWLSARRRKQHPRLRPPEPLISADVARWAGAERDPGRSPDRSTDTR